MTPRGLDHLVLPVRDLDRAGAFYETLGFTVGGRNKHPWGTENRIVQCPGTFLELITVGDATLIPEHRPGQFSFGAFIRDALARREGFAMLVLESRDNGADQAAFAKSGIGGYAPFHFEREGTKPDGQLVKVGFSLAFARDGLAPGLGFFTCQQHVPENFWNPAFQSHPNGATAFAGVIMVADNPSDHAEFLSAFSGVRDYVATSTGLCFETPRGLVEVMTPEAYRFHTGESLDASEPRLAAFRVRVPDLSLVQSRLGQWELPRRQGRIVIPAENAFGTTILFEA
jgi:catechol 2,3-dioxygenase-like lactoylglutathione lyase family enzyme